MSGLRGSSRFCVLGVVAIALIPLAMGCGEDDDPRIVPPLHTGGVGGAGGLGAAGGGTAASGGNAAGGSQPHTRGGSVEIEQSVGTIGGQPFESYSVLSRFWDGVGPRGLCGVEEHSPCSTLSCPPEGGSSDEPPYPDSGIITISGGLELASLTPDATGFYPPAVGGVLFDGGELLSIDTAGAVVPAFSASLNAPLALTMTAPALPTPGDALDVDRGAGMVLSWSGAVDATVHAFVARVPANDESVLVYCRFASAAGSGTIPPEALAPLPPGEGLFRLSGFAEAGLLAGEFDVTMVVYRTATDPSGALASADVIIH